MTDPTPTEPFDLSLFTPEERRIIIDCQNPARPETMTLAWAWMCLEQARFIGTLDEALPSMKTIR